MGQDFLGIQYSKSDNIIQFDIMFVVIDSLDSTVSPRISGYINIKLIIKTGSGSH